jgi:hypothetical protein
LRSKASNFWLCRPAKLDEPQRPVQKPKVFERPRCGKKRRLVRHQNPKDFESHSFKKTFGFIKKENRRILKASPVQKPLVFERRRRDKLCFLSKSFGSLF